MVSMNRLTQLPPRFLIPLVTKLIQFAHALLAWIIPPPFRAVQLAFEARAVSEVMRTVCALNIAETLADGPKNAKDLSLVIGADADRMFRLMRFAVMQGVFATVPSSRKEPQSASSLVFKNNRLSDTLRADHELSQKAMVFLAVGSQHCGDGWTELEWGVRTGGLCFEKIHNAPFFEHIATVPGAEDNFLKAMHAIDSIGGPSVLADYNWKKYGRYVDVAGAYGSFLADLMAQNPRARGTLFDRPQEAQTDLYTAQVIEESEQLWRKEERFKALLPRVDFATGDFFTPGSLPQARSADDVYILRQICHDWPDEATIRILKSVRVAMGNTKCMLALVEAVILPTSCTQVLQNRARTISDLHMMVQHNGKERATHEWAEVLAASGFALVRVVPTRSMFSIVEAVPIPLEKLV